MKNLLYVFLFLFLYSCTKKEIKIPPYVLSKEQMVPLLADVHIAQSANTMYGVSDTMRYPMKDFMTYILKIHHTTQAQYDSSISFYSNHPEMMKDIYDKVITELSKKQGEVEGSNSKPKQ
jgi:hypothetical protein